MPQTFAKPIYADGRGRILLSKDVAGQAFIVDKNDSGAFVVIPAITIPIEDAQLQNDPEILAGIERANQDVREGRVYKREAVGSIEAAIDAV